MKSFIFGFFLFFSLSAFSSPVFKITIYSFPQSLDPQLQGSSTSYLFQNLFRNLFYYRGNGELVPDLAEKCVREKQGKALHCWLRNDLKWNQGEKITSQDFLKTYQKILDPSSKSQRPDFLFPLVNAREIFEGKKKVDSLGVRTPSDREIVFEFTKPDAEFEYHLSSFYLTPQKGSYDLGPDKTFFTTGPYQIKKWNQESILVTSNPNYPGHEKRPDVEFFVVEEDSVSLRLYEKGELHVVRRIPTLLLSKYQIRPDFYAVPALRFDYVGFGTELKEKPEVRRSLAQSLNYPEWQSLLFSVGRPGCTGLPETWFDKKVPCYEFSKTTISKDTKIQYVYSQQGGDDHRRTAEWLQSQWKKNLGIEVTVRGMENKSFVAELKKNPPTTFRKGLAPDRPTCAGVLENFTTSHPENYIKNRDPEFDAQVEELRQTHDAKKKRKLCRTLFEKFMNSYALIPTGNYNLTFLVSPKFSGWKLNELNQLDLSGLESKNVK